MLGRTILIAAALLYLSVVGCALWDHDSEASGDNGQPPPGLVDMTGVRPFVGAAMQLYDVDGAEKYKKAIDRLHADGGDTVELVICSKQENGESVRIYLDRRHILSDASLGEIISHAKQLQMRVVLMPIVLLDAPLHDEWRGELKPHDVHEWFDSYRDMLKHYATLASTNGVDVLVVGSELVSMEKYEQEWIDTIDMTRQVFKGALTYSANWDNYYAAELSPIWRRLDLIGINSYWTLGEDRNVTKQQIEKKWGEIQQKLFGFAAGVHKPVLLLEAGWCSLSNAARDPWDYTQHDVLPADPELQEKLYDAFFSSWWGKPTSAGFMIWEWTTDPDPNGKGYSPEGKPAESVLRQWLAKQRWSVVVP